MAVRIARELMAREQGAAPFMLSTMVLTTMRASIAGAPRSRRAHDLDRHAPQSGHRSATTDRERRSTGSRLRIQVAKPSARLGPAAAPRHDRRRDVDPARGAQTAAVPLNGVQQRGALPILRQEEPGP